MKNRRNTKQKNSQGISRHEFKLDSAAAPARVRDLYQDFDYLDKLSPEEFAWMSEFMASTTTGFKVEAGIVGEENAEKMNSPEWLRPVYRENNTRNRVEIHTNSAKSSKPFEEYITFSSDDYLYAIEEADERIDTFWEENSIYK